MKISYVNSLCVSHDAISAAVRNEIRWLRDAGHEVRLFAYACDDQTVPFTRVDSAGAVGLDAHFQSSELVVFHFGVFYPLFDLLPLAPKGARRVVVFHNITPKQFVAEANHDTIDRSFKQMTNIVWADQVICDSHTNLKVLRESEIHVPMIVLPLSVSVESEAPTMKPSHRDGLVRIAFVGRFVRSKGALDLLEAVGALLERNATFTLRIDMVGNLAFSDAVFFERLRAAIVVLHRDYGTRVKVEIAPNASEAAKQRILWDADLFVLPTYHEGFCVPVLEALAHGCEVISYDNSNLPSISGGLGALVPTGNIEALSQAMESQMVALRNARFAEPSIDLLRRRRIADHLGRFSPENTRRSFLRIIDTVVHRPLARLAATQN